MKDKIIQKLKGIGEQLYNYAPLFKASGYEVTRIEVKLLLGIIPSATPFIEKVSQPNIELMAETLKKNSAKLNNLITNIDKTANELFEIAARAKRVKNSADNKEYAALVAEALDLLSKQVTNPVAQKLLKLVASLSGPKQEITIKGYEMKEFALDISVLPTVKFALIKI
jgi:nanoRNase/pAp phosphatase (c-di-AMP/oligoRNAs hydrolase)